MGGAHRGGYSSLFSALRLPYMLFSTHPIISGSSPWKEICHLHAPHAVVHSVQITKLVFTREPDGKLSQPIPCPVKQKNTMPITI